MNVNFNGYGENAATFIADKTITEAGVPVKMKDNGTFPRICEQSRYAGHGESGYSPKSCGNRDRH